MEKFADEKRQFDGPRDARLKDFAKIAALTILRCPFFAAANTQRP
jgi:hypothetical protein